MTAIMSVRSVARQEIARVDPMHYFAAPATTGRGL